MAGQSATFTVEATGTAPLSYQWYIGATPISGATAASYTRANVQPADAGAYNVTVSNGAGTVRTFTAYGSAFSAGYSHSLCVKADGTLWATGLNNYGQLGDGSFSTRFSPEQIAAGVKAVAAGSSHSLFVKSDGTLWAAGYNGYGQLGDGTTSNQATPVQIATGVAAVAAGGYHSLFLKTDGALWGMGSNSAGQLGDGTATNRVSPVQIATGVQAMSAGSNHSLFIKTDGSLWGMGYNYDGQLGDGVTSVRYAPVQIATGVAAVAAGGYHTLFVKTDGTLWATGYNGYGQLADGTTNRRTSPGQVVTGVAAVAAGANHTLFVKTDGTLWTAGNNNSGQLGNGSAYYYNYYYYYYYYSGPPTQIATGVANVAAGGDFSQYRRNDGTLWAMGFNSSGQLGDGSSNSRATPLPVLCPGDNPAVLTVILPPVIATQPASQLVSPGGTSNLAVTATGTAPFTYQWYKDGAAIAGATVSSYTVSAFSIAKAGNYTVTVTNAARSVTSQPAALSLGLTFISAQTAINGKGVTFFANTGGAGTVSWQVSTDEGATWTTLADNATYLGTNTVMLQITQATAALNNHRYRYSVTDSSQTVTSSAATLHLITSPLRLPSGIVVDRTGTLYVTDVAAQRVLRITPDLKLAVIAGKSGVAGSADGQGENARFNEPSGFILADDGSMVLADASNATIRAISASGVVNTLAGQSGRTGAVDGDNASALFSAPVGMSADLAGVYLVTDQTNHLVRTITGGRVRTLAGRAGVPGVADGDGATASFNLPTGITIRRDPFGSISWNGHNNGYGTIFVSDQGSHTIRTILANGRVGTYLGQPSLAGSADGFGTSARFNRPTGLTFDGDGNLYIADTGNHTIRKVTPTGLVSTYAGVPTVSGLMDGAAATALFNEPEGLAFDNDRNLYVTDTGNSAIRKITPAGQVTTLAILGGVPIITTQPAGQTLAVGARVTFAVEASGDGPMSYQWKKDGAAISGATSDTYTLASFASVDAGSYTMVVTNSWGSASSAGANLAVASATPPPSSPQTPSGSNSSGGGGGGGGAPSLFFVALLAATAGLRLLLRNRQSCPLAATPTPRV
ncbi:MAG: immunoglobulin domain-containing protein [Lacunisphaera sp.]|nr:immunoglobulin domain-containing protein [Lacunisphaera sp.]